MSHVLRVKRMVSGLCIAIGVAVATAGAVGFASEIRNVQMMDACDPETFNAAFGDGTCVRNGGVQLDNFFHQLEVTGQAGAWHFAPGQARLRDGQAVQATNHGGEVHTFTEVEEFGGGFIPELNELAGTPDPAPECLALGPADFVPPGASTPPDAEEKGTHHYMCCIHPWMRTDVVVR
jgi:plastocyanin